VRKTERESLNKKSTPAMASVTVPPRGLAGYLLFINYFLFIFFNLINNSN
jgi:hypothetical protein